MITDMQDVEPETLELPESVRTPGRTWTTYPEDGFKRGEGSVTVEAPDAVTVAGLEEARERWPDELAEAFFGEIAPEDNRLAAYHARFLDDAVVVRVPDGATVRDPVRIEANAEEGFFPVHVVVLAGDGSSTAVVENGTGEAACASAFTEVAVGKDANVQYTKINALETGFGYSENRAVVGENGTMGWTLVSVGGAQYRNRAVNRLAGPRSRVAYRLAFLASGEQHMDVTSHVIHDADHTSCDMDSRGVVMDGARGIYQGVQEVNQEAEGTKSFQDERTVLIGDDAEADTTPQLRIDNNDVEATHAATTGHIDQKDLFYMRSRGISEREAVREIVTGMFDDLVDEEPTDDAEETLHRTIRETLR